MTIDLERFCTPPEEIADLSPTPAVPRHGPRETFLRGPIPFAWLAEAARLPGAGFPIAMGVWYLARRFNRDLRASVSDLAEFLGFRRTATQTALHRAEAAGLIAVRRDPGCKLVLTLPKIPKDPPGPKPLWGPIPWSWWSTASRLPGSSLQVGAVCWLVAGWRRSAEFPLPSGPWTELDLSPRAISRGLNHLDRAELITVASRPGRPSVVRLRPRTMDATSGAGPRPPSESDRSATIPMSHHGKAEELGPGMGPEPEPEPGAPGAAPSPEDASPPRRG